MQLTDNHDGTAVVSLDGMAVLFGVDVATVTAEIDRQGGGTFDIPAEWRRNARRRANEAAAATSKTDLTSILAHLEKGI